MDDNDYLIIMMILILWVLVVVITVRFTERLDNIDKQLDQLEAAPITEVHTITDAHTVTDATPDEPEEVFKEVRPEFLTSESVQKASEQPLEVVDEEIVIEEPESVPEASEGVYLGCYELTAYPWTGDPCANGSYPTLGYTVACNSLALGTRIYIEGYGEYVVEDRGGMPDNVIDVYMGDYESCIQFGRRSANVYLID